MPVEGNQNLPSPLLSDPPDGPAQISAVNVATAQRLNMRFANAAARDAELPNPVEGMECFIGTGATAVKQIYWDSAWQTLYSGDIGWTDCTTKNGFTFQPNFTPQVCRIGFTIHLRGGWSSDGMTANSAFSVGDVPAGFEPVGQNVYTPIGASGGDNSGMLVVSTGGNVQIRTGSDVSGYYLLASTVWVRF